MMTIVVFGWSVLIVACIAAFLLSLAVKWGWLEWLQIHAPNAFFDKLFHCHFCCSWWASLGVSVILAIILQCWWILAVPLCSTVIAVRLW